MCVFICGGRSEGFVHVWVFRFGRLHMCLCLRREGTMEGGWCLFCFVLFFLFCFFVFFFETPLDNICLSYIYLHSIHGKQFFYSIHLFLFTYFF